MPDNVALTRRWFEEVWNQNRTETIDELLAPDVLIHGLDKDGQQRAGPEHFKRFFSHFQTALSDIHMTVEDLLVDGDKTAARLSVRAIHSGDGFAVPATGRRITTTGIVIIHWRNGRIAESWNEFDAAGMMQQIAALMPATLRA